MLHSFLSAENAGSIGYTYGYIIDKRERIGLFRRIMAVIGFMAILLCLTVSAAATETGSIRLETTGGTVALYKVGEINGQIVCLYEEYGGGIVGPMDILSENLAAWLHERAQNGHVKDTDIRGDTIFENLSPGLYLLTQPSTPSGQEPFEPFLITLPWDGSMWDVTVNLEILPETGASENPGLWIGGMLFSAAGIGICMLIHRKRIVISV